MRNDAGTGPGLKKWQVRVTSDEQAKTPNAQRSNVRVSIHHKRLMMRSGNGFITNLPASWTARSLPRLGLTSQPEVSGLPPLPLALVSFFCAG
jgi:hypothetical protein